MSNVFEFGDALLPPADDADEDAPPPEVGPNQPYLNLATYDQVSYCHELLLTDV